jgi:hypothetical protein
VLAKALAAAPVVQQQVCELWRTGCSSAAQLRPLCPLPFSCAGKLGATDGPKLDGQAGSRRHAVHSSAERWVAHFFLPSKAGSSWNLLQRWQNLLGLPSTSSENMCRWSLHTRERWK